MERTVMDDSLFDDAASADDSDSFPPRFDSTRVEARILSGGGLPPRNPAGAPFSMVVPPPILPGVFIWDTPLT